MSFKARVMNPIGIGAAIGAAVFAVIAVLPEARGEIVYESEIDQGPVEIRTQADTFSAAEQPRADDRQQLRQALTTSEKSRATRQAVQPAPQPVVVTPQPVYVAPAPVIVGEAAIAAPAEPAAAPVENFSKTELMRRERVREEVRNEDAIQERLEQLRLRDEKRRSEHILKGEGFLPAPQVAQPAYAAPALQEEYVAPPITETPGAGAAGVAGVNPAVQNTTTVEVAPVAAVETADEEKTQIAVRPMAGLTSMNVNSAFDVQPRFSAGIGVGVGASENVTFELGYTYSDHGIRVGSTNPLVAYYQNIQVYQGYSSPETIGLKQNVFDAGMKLALLGQSAKIRPFLGGGGGYSKNFVNYTDGYINILNQFGQQSAANDYESSAFLGYLTTGIDVKISKTVTLGGQFKYYGVLSSRESSQLNFNGFYGNPMWYGQDADKRAVGASLSESSFYSILGTASFVF